MQSMKELSVDDIQKIISEAVANLRIILNAHLNNSYIATIHIPYAFQLQFQIGSDTYVTPCYQYHSAPTYEELEERVRQIYGFRSYTISVTASTH